MASGRRNENPTKKHPTGLSVGCLFLYGCLGFDQVLSNVSVDAKTVIIMENTGMVKVGFASIIASTFSRERYT